ncbi:protein-tyrosine phosphatase-like protein [Zychaea mexicana]|uniref:protein-tyrosine phosphatase-like protein n=1 Tax=Zychaea mexicana TaxID=64656 RepID=UPI0022FDFAE1|nr:protein-tyrosine phosphatase-like protein [Zychaea mexicana]KAI9494769.1 protein-tyrosine phosphatase-like protein [Zychaea mexicana]
MVSSYLRSDSPLGRMLSLIETPGSALRFLILDCPTESTLSYYVDEFKRYNVTHVARCCQQTYNAARLAEEGIQVLDMPFKDGGVPPATIVRDWLQLVDTQERKASEENPVTIAVHCVAGLGRAPVLVAIALIELGMEPLDAVEFVRRKRRGAFNKPQIAYLDQYKRSLRQKSSSSVSFKSSLGKMFRFGNKKQQEPEVVTIH